MLKFFAKILRQFHLKIVFRREIGMAAFTRKRMMTKSIPVETRNPKAGARGNHGTIAFRIFCTFAQGDEIL